MISCLTDVNFNASQFSFEKGRYCGGIYSRGIAYQNGQTSQNDKMQSELSLT